jgi:type IV secretory pathway TrbF-like protein
VTSIGWPAIADYQPTDPQIAFHLARFIEDVRNLPPTECAAAEPAAC